MAIVEERTVEQQPVAARFGGLFDTVDDGGEVRVVKVVDQQPERPRLLAGEVAGDQVGPIAELVGGRHHRRARRLR